MTEINPEALLAFTRARQRAVNARAEAARARLGAESRPRRSLTDGLSAEEIERDAQSIRNVLKAWKRRRLCNVGISNIRLPSGRTLVYDWQREEIVK